MQIAMKSIMKAENLYNKKENLDNDSYGYPIFHIEIQETMNLASRVQVEEQESIVIIIVDKLLEEER